MGVFFTVGGCLTGVVGGFSTCSVGVVRARRVRGLSTPDKATVALTRKVVRGISHGSH